MGRPEDWVLDLTGKVLYLDSCAALRVTPQRLHNLREATGLRMICGYAKSIDWFDSAGFDVILLSALAQAMDGKDQQRAKQEDACVVHKRCHPLVYGSCEHDSSYRRRGQGRANQFAATKTRSPRRLSL